MTRRQMEMEKEVVDGGIMALKCLALVVAVVLAWRGYLAIPLMIALKEVAELLLFCIRILHERKYHDVLHD